MAKRKPARAKAAKAAAKKSTRRAASRATTRRAKKASSRSAKRPTAKKAKKKATRKVTRKATRQVVARKAAARKAPRTTKRAKPARVAAKRAGVQSRGKKKNAAVKARKKSVRTMTPAAKAAVQTALPLPAAVAPKAARTPAPRPKRAPTLDRARKTVGDPSTGSGSSRAKSRDEPEPHGVPSSLDVDRSPSAARSGRKEMNDKLREHTSTSPSITAGDVDADWEAAESVGDEAPGGDNPTPDQDVVDDIGRALGVEYDDDEELKGGDEIAARDRHRWELDPSSSDDYDDRD